MATAASRKLTPNLAHLIALLAGCVLPYTFAPTNLWPLSFVLIGLLYWLVQSLTPRQGLFTGWLFGLGYFGLGVNWVYHSIHMFGDAVAPLAAFVTLVFVLVMTVFPALTVWLYLRWRLPQRWWLNALLFASLWVLAELLRGKVMGGFPWILVGYSQTTQSLGALAPVIGVYGIGFIVVWILPFVIDVITHATSVKRKIFVAVGVVAAMTVSVMGLSTLNSVPWSLPKANVLKVRLVQANITQEMKFSRERLKHSLELYTELTMKNLAEIDLVIWPETAIPTFFKRVDDVLAPFVKQLDKRGIDVLTGGFYSEEDRTYNSVRQLGGDKALYQKRHLVPFGEFMPMRFLLDSLAQYIVIPMSDLSAGDGPYKPLALQGEAIGVSICYEDVYGEEMRGLLPAATVLINVSNDAWFGDTAAPHQHQQKAQMRAREFARPLIRVTNTGISSAIDYQGNVLDTIAHNTQGVIDVDVIPRTGITPYARTGNWPIFLFSLAIILLHTLLRRALR